MAIRKRLTASGQTSSADRVKPDHQLGLARIPQRKLAKTGLTRRLPIFAPAARSSGLVRLAADRQGLSPCHPVQLQAHFRACL